MLQIIAEIGSNHNQDWKRCCDLVTSAKEMGFSAVKFQLFKAEKITRNKNSQNKYKKQELNIDWIPEIAKLCKRLGLFFGITPFYLEAIEEIKNYVDFIKISSFDILRKNLIKKSMQTKKDIYISCGLASNDNILNLIDLILDEGLKECKYYLLHCVSKYPTLIEEAAINRLAIIYSLIFQKTQLKKDKSNKNIFVGYSDHTRDIDVILEAVNSYAQIIELHFDLNDKLGSESKYKHCWTSSEISNLRNKLFKISNIINSKFIISEKQLKQLADPKSGLRG
jgi:sialic acid synthase SpsE